MIQTKKPQVKAWGFFVGECSAGEGMGDVPQSAFSGGICNGLDAM
jgi:hypothetical protein